MNTLSAVELKRRGIVAIEEALAFGPVHILKHNHPAAVVMLESEYQTLVQKTSGKHNADAVRWIMDFKPVGTRSQEEIDKQISQERSSWV
ncbi:MAG: type II toxin-antitoxin system Phd/YefM family antitoxin [Chlorobiaceae bacterium]|nr:type II toxin-antitoxin system Phd/YefM family antitoxin [Chlorobiaceae bacterium]